MRFILAVGFLVTTCAALTLKDFFQPYLGVGKYQMRRLEKDKMMALMDVSVDPCEDFFEYSCGGWRSIPDFTDSTAVEKERTRQLFEEPGTIIRTRMPATVMSFYRKCLMELPNALQLVERKALEVRAWMKGEMERGEFDWLSVAANLAKLGVDAFIGLEEESIDNEINLKIAYKQDTFISLALGDAGVAGSIQGAIPLHTKLSQYFSAMPESKLETKFYPSELKNVVKTMDLERYLSIRFGVNITRRVFVDNPERLNKLGEFLSQQTTTDLFEYLYAKTLVDLLFKFQMSSPICAVLTEEMFRYQILMAISEDFPRELQDEVFDLIMRLQQAQVEMFKRVSWFDAYTRKGAINKAVEVHKHLSVDKGFLSNECLTDVYQSFQVTEKNIVDLIVSHNVNDKLLKCFANLDAMYLQMGTMSLNAAFAAADKLNMHIFPAVMLPPFYSYEYPFFKKFSSFASIIGHELMHNFDKKNIKRNYAAFPIEWWSPNVTQKLMDQYKCSMLNIDEGTDREDFSDILGLRITYDAFKKWQETTEVSMAEELQGFEDLRLNTDQLFFLNYAQGMCLLVSERINATFDGSDKHSPPSVRVRLPVSSLPAFAEAFNCPVGAAMNPAKRCDFFV